MPSTFSYNGQSTHVSWSDVAPPDENGRPLSTVEATRAGLVEHYDRDARAKQQASESFDRDRVETQRRERAKRDAWNTLSARNRIVI